MWLIAFDATLLFFINLSCGLSLINETPRRLLYPTGQVAMYSESMWTFL